MNESTGVQLAVVDINLVLPHEVADPVRERRIEARLQADRVLRDPLMVGAVLDLEGYVLLDGTNRRRALTALGLPWLLAQVVDYRDAGAVALKTWCHQAQRGLAELRRGAEAISGIDLTAIPQLGVVDALQTRDTLAVILDRNQQLALVRRPDAPSRAEQLRGLVDLYEMSMRRVDCNPDDAEDQARLVSPGNETLIAFPPFSRSQVVTMATRQTPIPAGITRHIILGGRALRVDLPLEVLASSDLESANRALESHLGQLQPRRYREPTILFDS